MSKRHRKRRGVNTGRRLDMLLRMQRKTLWIADGECCEQLRLGQAHKPVGDFGRYIDHICKAPHPWQIIGLGFLIADNGERYYSALHYERTGSIKSLQPEINRLVDEMLAKQNHRHLVSWGWWASPAGDLDLSATEETVLEQFLEWGAWDRHHCENTMLLRKLQPND